MALYIPTSVLVEVSAICFEGKRHKVEDLYKIVNLLNRCEVKFRHPNQVVAEICYNLYRDDWRDDRMTPTDLAHLGYALAYDADYFITGDRILNEYRIPGDFKLKVLTPDEAIKRFQ
jgi:predicted nucleic acid-binding protein